MKNYYFINNSLYSSTKWLLYLNVNENNFIRCSIIDKWKHRDIDNLKVSCTKALQTKTIFY